MPHTLSQRLAAVLLFPYYLLLWLIATTYAAFTWLWYSNGGNIAPSELLAKSILISGCDSGFGHLLALKCLRAGWGIVFAGCLTDEGQRRLVAEAEKIPLPKGRLQTLQLDVRSQESVERARAGVEKLLQMQQNGVSNSNIGDGGVGARLDALVNNAGIAGATAWDDWIHPNDYEVVWQVNTMGVIRLTHTFKPLIKRARGRIVTIASSLGRVALPGCGPYNVSKFAVEAYCDTLRREMAIFGVHVSILEPGYFRTPITEPATRVAALRRVWEHAPVEVREEYGEEFFAHSLQTMHSYLTRVTSTKVELVVDAYYHALTARRPRKRYAVGWDAKLIFVPGSLLPTGVQDAIFWLLARLEGHPVPSALAAVKIADGGDSHKRVYSN